MKWNEWRKWMKINENKYVNENNDGMIINERRNNDENNEMKIW